MNSPNFPNRRGRKAPLALESLEARELMTGGAGNTFAITPGTVTSPGGTASITFTIDPSHFTMPHGNMTLGLDVAGQPGAGLKPQIASITDAEGHTLPISHSPYDPRVKRNNAAVGRLTSAVVVPISLPSNTTAAQPETFTVNVVGLQKTSGKFLLGFYLPGDATGDGVVDQADFKAVRAGLHTNGNVSAYNFYADANRDGRIAMNDLATVRKNMGVKVTISPVISSNLDPGSVTQPGTRIASSQTVKFTGTATPGAQITYSEVNQRTPDVSTTADATGDYSISIPLAVGTNTFKVTTKDGFGQSITGNILPVTYAPSLVKPSTGSTNT
jgi:hypothetical protein